MNDDKNALPETVQLQTEKIFAEIESAGSMIVAAQSGASANGFVLELICACGITVGQFYIQFDQSGKAVDGFSEVDRLGYKYTVSILASDRIMASRLQRESGIQHPGSDKRFECGVYGVLIVNLWSIKSV